jgi:hypothetical protein
MSNRSSKLSPILGTLSTPLGINEIPRTSFTESAHQYLGGCRICVSAIVSVIDLACQCN